jgi:hypothetical protein
MTETAKLSAQKRRRLIGHALETLLINIAVENKKRDIVKAQWVMAQIEDLTRFDEFAPIRGELNKLWRKGREPRAS